MLSNPHDVFVQAQELDDPVVAMDPAAGSLQATFFLVDWKNRGVRPGYLAQKDRWQLTRECFNGMKEKEMLDTYLAHRRKFHDQCQAWPVRRS